MVVIAVVLIGVVFVVIAGCAQDEQKRELLRPASSASSDGR